MRATAVIARPYRPRELMILLLRYLALRSGRVIIRAELTRALWGQRVQSSNTLSVHILRLRKRLGDHHDQPRWIGVVRGLGYQFTVPGPDPRSLRIHRR